ncbi:glycosyltransferase [Candidatus Saccharibacteria bacterium]|nr:glycosyltransferase family 2 protein [Candidatus Saccharibacteria bacterium]NIV04479.1 glycosyltransferase [Calditrichia bacterium]NIS39037.1 glycosyltransferase family 2 protein [Candidatus Saccharibacteria bacterium]NIV73073.1 glycosyltransferase [Calditrichia bacterium]NIW00346.1 glycosyltransferase [Candidatus Saccharibacteria bacterium]
MDLSLIILNYKTVGLTRQCLKSIRLANPDLDYEVIVVDNDSGDGVAKMLEEQFPEVKFIASSHNSGFAGGNNQGIEKAQGRYIHILNPDITVSPGSLEKMVQYMEEHPDVGILAPQLLNPDKSVQYSCYRFPKPSVPIYRRTPLGKTERGKKVIDWYLMKDWDHNNTREVDWCLAASVMVRKAAIEQVGLLDEQYFMYFEDCDWSRRFWQAGYKVVYFPEAKMVHYHVRQSADVPWFLGLFQKISRIHIASAIKYFIKFRGKQNPRNKNKNE